MIQNIFSAGAKSPTFDLQQRATQLQSGIIYAQQNKQALISDLKDVQLKIMSEVGQLKGAWLRSALSTVKSSQAIIDTYSI